MPIRILSIIFSLIFSLPVCANMELLESFRRPNSIPFPVENPYSAIKATLGKMLFFDPRVSRNKNMNCASCHNPSFGWEVPMPKALDALAMPLTRHSPTLLNRAWGSEFFWDGRAITLEEQARGPIENRLEMNFKLPDLLQRLNSIAGYRQLFTLSFPKNGLTEETILKAIATYERTIVSSEAPFDTWVRGDNNAISMSAKRGFNVFTRKAQCSNCHSGWNFTDDQFHDIGLRFTDDVGRFGVTANENDLYAFKTPGLRNISQRAPYMHDGRFASLRDVIEHYHSKFEYRRTVSHKLRPFQLSKNEITDLVEFLYTLTGTDMIVSLPVLPR